MSGLDSNKLYYSKSYFLNFKRMAKVFPLIIFFMMLMLPSCKPTEKGYKAAYDAALGKREAAKDLIDVDLPEGALQDVDGPQLKEVNGEMVYVLNQRIQPVETGYSLPGEYNVAVGTYKMITNCNSQAAALKGEGYEAFPAKEPDGMYFTIAGSFSSLDEAVKFYQKYKTGKDRAYVGLPNSPVIIYSPR